MAAFVHRQVGMKRVGGAANVPNNPTAKLMYYLDSVTDVLNIDGADEFTNYSRYWALDTDDKKRLLVLVLTFSPDELVNKVFFHSDQLCGERANGFYELTQVNNILAVRGSVMVAGQNKRVNKIMTYTMGWMQRNYFTPLMQLTEELRRANQEARERASQSCTIL